MVKRSHEDEELDNIKIHPLLQQPINVEPKKVKKNPLLSDWRERNNQTLNPYIDQEDISLSFKNERKKILGGFSDPGRQIAKAESFREKLRKERIEREEYERLKQLNLLPDLSIGEDKYEEYGRSMPPYVEWWDANFVINGRYDGDNFKDDPELITSYIQHPVPIDASWRKINVELKPMFLTKSERRKLRRNRRMLEMKDKQDRIKLGLEPAPPNKVSLKNLVNVLTNESISNPTEVEMRVRNEVYERQLKHEQMNEERRLSKEEKRQKLETKMAEELRKGIYCLVCKVKRLVNPKHVYKVDMNAKQFKLMGVCLTLIGDKSLIIVEGGHKNIEKYKRLLTNRINWRENEHKKGEDISVELEDLSSNYCEIVWEGEIRDFRFMKWSSYKYDNEESLLKFLDKFGIENYWRS
ncbi:hypothetical protein CANINC_000946 [Pichia inconspicua]|uniref:Uncharacterized protein n=1 Tax=Pichia inconspicua TaxID=52247 RepID=A0A4T0X560_9ASCO|nr:hypothetical protein CANINC_000946 [[Candida] inconspicua]